MTDNYLDQSNQNFNLKTISFDELLHDIHDDSQPTANEDMDMAQKISEIVTDKEDIKQGIEEKTPIVEKESEVTKEETNQEQIDPNYLRLIAAQKESERRLKILSIMREERYRNKNRIFWGITAGVAFAGTLVASYFAKIDYSKALSLELGALNSFQDLRSYLSTITPAMWAGMITTVVSICEWAKENKKYHKAVAEHRDWEDTMPEKLLGEADRQASIR